MDVAITILCIMLGGSALTFAKRYKQSDEEKSDMNRGLLPSGSMITSSTIFIVIMYLFCYYVIG